MAAKTASLSVNIIADAAKARAGLKEAETAFGKFRREVGEAQGAMGKFQAIGTSALNYVKANALAFASTAGAAIAGFVVKSVAGFQDLALSAGKFADATGLSSEEASRFIEVAGDIGIEAGKVEKSLGFMNKTLGNSPDLFRKLGVEIAYASNGATDVNGTFMNVVQRLNEIDDPAQRAAAATQLLGRGWMELSELIGMGADDLAASLASVSDAKVIDEDEVRRAREFRAAVDELRDRFDDLANNIGERVVPVLIEVLGYIDKISGGDISAGSLTRIAEQFDDDNFVNNVKRLKDEQEFLNKAWQEGYRAQINARSASAQLQIAMEQQAAAVEAAKIEWDIFRNGLNIKQETLSVLTSIEDFRTKWAGATDEAKAKSREYQQDLLRNQAAVAALALSIVGLATTAQNTRIRMMIETGQLERAWSLIQAIQSGLNSLAGAATPDRIERQIAQAGGIGGSMGPPSGRSGITAPPPPKPTTTKKTYVAPKSVSLADKLYSKMASGGTVTAGGLTLVGEEGPELLNLPRRSSVIPSIPTRQIMGSGQTIINVTVQAGLVSSADVVGQQIIEAIRRAERRSGKVFANV